MKKAIAARRGAFTLVELLIVIIIIAILAGMMMLTTGSATDRAEATKIISDLRNIKAAAHMYYLDHKVWPDAGNDRGDLIDPPTGWVISLERYLDRSIDKKVGFARKNASDPATETKYIGFDLNGPQKVISASVRKKLEESARDSGLYSGDNTGGITTLNGGYYSTSVVSGQWVFMSFR